MLFSTKEPYTYISKLIRVYAQIKNDVAFWRSSKKLRQKKLRHDGLKTVAPYSTMRFFFWRRRSFFHFKNYVATVFYKNGGLSLNLILIAILLRMNSDLVMKKTAHQLSYRKRYLRITSHEQVHCKQLKWQSGQMNARLDSIKTAHRFLSQH